jgi:hypothetical protein
MVIPLYRGQDPAYRATLLLFLTLFSVRWNMITVTYRQSIVSSELLGRVKGANRFLEGQACPGRRGLLVYFFARKQGRPTKYGQCSGKIKIVTGT